jgi:hypothetical protein
MKLKVLIKTKKKYMGMEVQHPASVISFLSVLYPQYYLVWTAQWRESTSAVSQIYVI